MSGIVCSWANLPEEVADWYKDIYVKHQNLMDYIHTLQCDITASGMEHEPVGKLDAPWPYLTINEVKDVKWANKQIQEATSNLPDEVKSGPLKHVQFDVRSYTEVKRWQNADWKETDGNVIEHVVSVAAMEWTIAADKEEEVLKFYQETVGPTIIRSPDVLRFRLFKIDTSLTLDKEQQTTFKDVQQLHKYFTLVELEVEEWPWDVVIDLAEEQGWKDYFETQQVVKWQLSHYLVSDTTISGKQEASAS